MKQWRKRKAENWRYTKGKFKTTTAEQNIDEKNGLKYCRALNDNTRTSWLLTLTIFNSFVTVVIFEIIKIAFFIILVAPEDVLNLPVSITAYFVRQICFVFFLFVCFFFFPEARFTGLFGSQHLKQWKLVVFSAFFTFWGGDYSLYTCFSSFVCLSLLIFN